MVVGTRTRKWFAWWVTWRPDVTLVPEMADQSSPWARPDTVVEVEPAAPASTGAAGPSRGPATATLTRGARSGAVTRTAEPAPPPDVIEVGPDDPVRRNQVIMRWFGVAAGVVVVIGLVITLVMVTSGRTGGPGPFNDRADAPSDYTPDLIKRCPPPSAYPEAQPPPPPPPGPRTVDEETGISYKAYGSPWETWPQTWVGGTLRVAYKVGQHFITEHYSGGDYHASILSASTPATVNDALAIDLKCTGRQVAADVRTQYYPQPNRVEQIREEETRLGGRPAWVSVFRLHFNDRDLDAKSELVGIGLIDVGRPAAAIIYISIPDTHRQYDPIVNEVLDSVRPV